MSTRVSVVIATYRRPDLLGRCLSALAGQSFSPTEYEVVIADDADLPATREQVDAFATAAPFRVIYVPVRGRHGPAAARNAGWRAAGGAVVAFTDDDTIPDPGWLMAGVGVLERDSELAAVAGQVVVPLPEAPTDYQKNEAGLEGAEFVTANCFVRRSALDTVGGFDERFTAAWREDSDLQFRLFEMGARVGKVPEAVVVHHVRQAGWGISLKQQRKCLFDALLYRQHPVLYRRHIGSPPWGYYGIVGSLVAVVWLAVAGWKSAALVPLAVWALLSGAFLRRRLRGTSRTPGHVAEMVVTSLLIPELSIFWRLYGALKFRVLFF